MMIPDFASLANKAAKLEKENIVLNAQLELCKLQRDLSLSTEVLHDKSNLTEMQDFFSKQLENIRKSVE